MVIESIGIKARELTTLEKMVAHEIAAKILLECEGKIIAHVWEAVIQVIVHIYAQLPPDLQDTWIDDYTDEIYRRIRELKNK